jgi:hypothetical protein
MQTGDNLEATGPFDAASRPAGFLSPGQFTLQASPRIVIMRVASLVHVGLVLVLSGSAMAQSQVCFDVQLPEIPTNWMQTATLPKFDTALGTLQQIDITLASDFHGSIGIESLDSTATVVTSQLSVHSELHSPDMTVLMGTTPTANFNDPLFPFDGTVDFGGTSGTTHNAVNASDSVSGMSTDFALFSGPPGNPGTLAFPVTAVGSSSASGSGNVVTQFTVTATANVQVCYTYLPNVPPVFQPPTPQCGAIFMATAGVPVSFTVCAGDVDATDVVTLTGTLPPGATTIPALPVSGNPACVTVNWTPTLQQLGNNVFTFTATDTHLRTASCTITYLVAECYQVIGRGGNGSNLILGGTTFPTFVGAVRLIYPVTMVDRPSIRIPSIASGQIDFSMQTLMHNPLVFPQNPDQWSNRLRVTVLPGQMVVGQLFDTLNGIHQGLSTFTDPVGDRYMTFPFTIDGM